MLPDEVHDTQELMRAVVGVRQYALEIVPPPRRAKQVKSKLPHPNQNALQASGLHRHIEGQIIQLLTCRHLLPSCRNLLSLKRQYIEEVDVHVRTICWC